MGQSIKKIIAREFLFLLGIIGITALAWLGFIIYNYTLQTKIDRAENDLVVANKKADSLRHQKFYITLPNIQKLFGQLIKDNYDLPNFAVFKTTLKDEKFLSAFYYNDLKPKYDLPDYNTFKDDMLKTQHVRIYPNGSQQTLKDFYVTLNAKPYLSDEELLSKFPEFENDKDAIRIAKEYIEVLNRNPNITIEEIYIVFPEFSMYLGLPHINAEGEPSDSQLMKKIRDHFKLVTEKEKVVFEIKNKRNHLKSPFSNDDIKDLLIEIFLYGLIIIFGGRYLFNATKWAIKTVRE